MLIPAMSIKVYIRGRVAVGHSSKDRWGIGSTNTPETWYRQLPTAGHTVRSDQCQILTQTRRTMPTTSTRAGWDTMCLDSVLVYFRSILNFLSRTEDKIGRALSYISLPSFMLQVFFNSSDRSLLIWQSGCGVGQRFREVPNARPRPQIMRILPMISTRDGLGSNWLFRVILGLFLAEIGQGLVTNMNIKNGTKLCGCDYENIYGGRVQLEKEQPRNLIKPVRRWTLSIIGL